MKAIVAILLTILFISNIALSAKSYDFIGVYGDHGIENWQLVTKNNLYGFVDNNGKIIVPCEYDEFGILGNKGQSEWIIAHKGGKYGFINKEGKEIVPCEYDEISTFGKHSNSNWVLVQKEGKYGFIDDNGNVALTCNYISLEEIDDKYPGLIECEAEHYAENDFSTVIDEISKAFRDLDVEIQESLSNEEKQQIKDDLREAKEDLKDASKEVQEIFASEEFAEGMEELGEGMSDLLSALFTVSNDISSNINVTTSNKSKEGSIHISYQKRFEDETLNKEETFDISMVNNIEISLDIKSENGPINIKLYAPDGSIAMDVNSEENNVSICKVIDISDEEKMKYQGQWKLKIKTKKSTGSYKLSIEGR